MFKPDLIVEIVARYETVVSPELEALKYDARLLAIQYYYLASSIHQASKVSKEATAAKVEIFDKGVGNYIGGLFMDKPITTKQAELLAKSSTDYKAAVQTEIKAGAILKKMEGQLKGISRILDRMGQEISDLKAEKQYNKFTSGEHD